MSLRTEMPDWPWLDADEAQELTGAGDSNFRKDFRYIAETYRGKLYFDKKTLIEAFRANLTNPNKQKEATDE